MRIFKKHLKNIKLFDLITVSIVVIGIFVFALIFFRKSSSITVTVNVGQNDAISYTTFLNRPSTRSWFASLFHEGMVEKDGLGRIQAEVKDVYIYDRSPSIQTIYLKTKLKAIYSKSSNTYTYKGTPVLVGSKIKMDLEGVHVEGLVTNIEGLNNEKEVRKVVVESQLREDNPIFQGTVGTKDYLADSISIGDVVLDNNGNVILKILDKRVVPAKQIVTTSDGRVLAKDHPTRKDIYLSLEIRTTIIGGQNYFLDDLPVLVDQPIPVNTSKYSIFPIVTKFISDEKI